MADQTLKFYPKRCIASECLIFSMLYATGDLKPDLCSSSQDPALHMQFIGVRTLYLCFTEKITLENRTTVKANQIRFCIKFNIFIRPTRITKIMLYIFESLKKELFKNLVCIYYGRVYTCQVVSYKMREDVFTLP